MPVHIPTCHHLKANGVWCGSPALRGHRFCYFHHQWREDRNDAEPEAQNSGGPPLSAPPLGRQGGGPPFELPLLEDANAVQVALQRVMQAIINDEIDNRKAGLLLYALQTASSNLKNTRFEAYALKEQAQTEYANADPAEDDDPDACDICAYGDEEEEEDKEEDNEEDEQEGSEEENEEEDEEKEEQQPAAQQPATQPPAAIPAGREPTAEGRQQGLSPKLPPRSSPLPEHDEELDDEELIKAIRHLAGLT